MTHVKMKAGDNMNLEPYIEEFLKKQHRDLSCKKSTVTNLFNSENDYAFKKRPEYHDSDFLEDNIKDSVKAYTRDKKTPIEIYKKFVRCLNDKYGLNITVNFPPIDSGNSFERQMFIAKYLQNHDAKISDLEDILWVSKRVIEDDLARLRGNEDPIQVCGRVFTIPDFNRKYDRAEFASTAHPMFLTPNLTQVITMLKGLKFMAENTLYERYAIYTAVDIWVQLSDYAKDRIMYVLSELMPEDAAWYEALEKRKEDSFYTERRCGYHHNNVVLDCLKNEKNFYMEYKENGEVCFYSNCSIVPRSFDGESITVTHSNGEKKVYLENIVQSMYCENADLLV